MKKTVSVFNSATNHRHLVIGIALICVGTLGCDRKSDEGTKTVSVVDAPASSSQKSPSGLAEVAYEDKAITDEILQSWINNPSLRRLRIAGSDIRDAGLASLAKASKLELLDLTRCESLTSTGIEAISTMPTLRNLRISGPAVTDASIASFSKLNNLAALSLQQTAVTDNGLHVIEPMKNLKELNLYGTPITDQSLATIAELPNLQKLRLRGTKVTGENADAFEKMNAVIDLDLSETAFVSSGLNAIGKMPNLRSLNLWLTQVDDAGIEYLSGQTQLTLLNLDNVSTVTDKSLDTIHALKNLELLHLGGTSISADGLKKLYDLKNLKTLFITRLNLEDADVTALRDAMPWLTKLESE